MNRNRSGRIILRMFLTIQHLFKLKMFVNVKTDTFRLSFQMSIRMQAFNKLVQKI